MKTKETFAEDISADSVVWSGEKLSSAYFGASLTTTVDVGDVLLSCVQHVVISRSPGHNSQKICLAKFLRQAFPNFQYQDPNADTVWDAWISDLTTSVEKVLCSLKQVRWAFPFSSSPSSSPLFSSVRKRRQAFCCSRLLGHAKNLNTEVSAL